MNADDLGDGSAVADAGSKGERIVAGIIDTGVNPGLSKVTLVTAPLTTGGFAAIEKTFSVPTGVASLRIVLTSFSPTDTRTAGTMTFDDIGLYGE